MLLSFFFMALPSLLNAQLNGQLHGIVFGESLESAKDKLENHADTWNLYGVDDPVFPLAETKEVHLVGQQFNLGEKTIEEIVFTFTDDQLQYIEARGGAVEASLALQEMSLDTLLDYVASYDQGFFAKPSEEAIWLLSKEAMHPNLFAWTNPFLPSNGGLAKAYSSSVAIPDLVRLGASMEVLKPVMQEASTFTFEQDVSGGQDPFAKTQINCFGIEYASFPRKMEARFGPSGNLNMVWILTAKQEEDRVRQALVEEFGEAEWSNANWEAFAGWEVLLRKDKPEVLLVAEAPREAVKQWIMSGR